MLCSQLSSSAFHTPSPTPSVSIYYIEDCCLPSPSRVFTYRNPWQKRLKHGKRDGSALGALNTRGYIPGQSFSLSPWSSLTPSKTATRTPCIPDREISIRRRQLLFRFTKVPFTNHPIASLLTPTPPCRVAPGMPSEHRLTNAFGWRTTNGIRSNGRRFSLLSSPFLLTEYVPYIKTQSH